MRIYPGIKIYCKMMRCTENVMRRDSHVYTTTPQGMHAGLVYLFFANDLATFCTLDGGAASTSLSSSSPIDSSTSS